MSDTTREIANKLDCLTEAQFIELLHITASTAKAWRQRKKAPLPILIGNAYLYPMEAIREALTQRKKSPRNFDGVLA